MAASTTRRAAEWAALSTVGAYLLQGLPALAWFALNHVHVAPSDPDNRYPLPAYFWTDRVWVGCLLFYGLVIFAFGTRGFQTRRVITASVVATLGYLLVVAVLPASWTAQSPWPFPPWLQVFFLAAVIYYNGWILFAVPVIAWRFSRALLRREATPPYDRLNE